jgi:hypothetical protein
MIYRTLVPTVPYHVYAYSIQNWLGFSVDFEGKMIYRTVPYMFTHMQRCLGFPLNFGGKMLYGTYDVAGVFLELKDPGVDLLLDELNIQDLLNLLLDLDVVGQQQGGQHLPHLGEQHQSLRQQQIYRDYIQRFRIRIRTVTRFGPPGSGSFSQRYGSGSGSFSKRYRKRYGSGLEFGSFYQEKILRKTLISTVLFLLYGGKSGSVPP